MVISNGRERERERGAPSFVVRLAGPQLESPRTCPAPRAALRPSNPSFSQQHYRPARRFNHHFLDEEARPGMAEWIPCRLVADAANSSIPHGAWPPRTYPLRSATGRRSGISGTKHRPVEGQQRRALDVCMHCAALALQSTTNVAATAHAGWRSPRLEMLELAARWVAGCLRAWPHWLRESVCPSVCPSVGCGLWPCVLSLAPSSGRPASPPTMLATLKHL